MKYCFKSIHMLIKKYPSYLAVEVVSTILAIISSILPIYIVRDIINYYNEGKSIQDISIYVLIIFGIIALAAFIDYVFSLIKMNIQRLFIAKTSEDFYKKLAEIDYDFHENPAFLNDYTRALEQGVEHIDQVANNSFQTIRILIQSFSLLSVFSILAKDNFMIILIAFVIAIFYLLIYIRIGILGKRQNHYQRPFQRVSWYSNRAFSIRDGMADIKTSDIDKLLIDNNETSLDNAIKVYDKYASRITFWAYLGQICLVILYPAIIGFLAYKSTDVAVFASLTVAATNLSSLIARLASSIGEVESVLPETKVPFDVLAMHGVIEGVKGKEKVDSFESLEIKDVDFSYLGHKNQLDHINLDIKKGEHIAIVGANGAGKTTLVKLLLRLYDPKCGNITYNGKDYKDLDIISLRSKVGAVFQNVETYAVSIAENILLRKPKDEKDYAIIDEALKFSGLGDFVKTLKDGINTEISREFNNQGIVFSGGLNQRLAIARGYAQNYELFILDEPSSALDPIAETEVYKNMLAMGKDKTIIFISHRLTTTVNADKIYLFDDGKIIEEGTHEELMKHNGLYRKMFVSQSKKYIGDDYE